MANRVDHLRQVVLGSKKTYDTVHCIVDEKEAPRLVPAPPNLKSGTLDTMIEVEGSVHRGHLERLCRSFRQGIERVGNEG